VCRAVDILKKSVEQLRFEQMDFEQLTLNLTLPFIPEWGWEEVMDYNKNNKEKI
jgi:hypothetical protein